jgi:DNA polymerase V
MPQLLVRRITVTVGRLIAEDSLISQKEAVVQFNLFDNLEERTRQEEAKQRSAQKEKSLQHAMLALRNKFGKNAVLKAANLKEEARTIARNSEIGGHKA